MKRLFLLSIILVNSLAAGSQDVLLFDFDAILPGGNWPYDKWGGVSSIEVIDDPTFMGNKVAQITFNGTFNPNAAPGFLMQMLIPQSRDDFEGFTMKVRSDFNQLIFFFTLENGGIDPNVGNWTTFPAYTSDGGWQTLNFPFIPSMGSINFNRIALNLSCHNSTAVPSTFTLWIDDLILIRKTSAVKGTHNDPVNVNCKKGILHVQNLTRNTDVKIYNALGAPVYSAKHHSDFSVNLDEQMLSQGILFVSLNDGITKRTEKIVYLKQ
jgi:hypothetical protein